MLILQLFLQQLKSYFRAEKWRRNMFGKIIYGIMFLFLSIVFVSLGINIDKILAEIDENPVTVFNSMLLWYLSFDLILRYFFLSLPALQAVPYMRFRLRRSSIINYIIFRSYLNLFNIIPWFIIIPFSIKVIFPDYGTGVTMVYLIGIFLLITLNHYMGVLLNLLSLKKFIYSLIPLAIIASLIILEKTRFFSIDNSIILGECLMHSNPLFFSLLLISIIILLAIIHRMLLSIFYIDNISEKRLNIFHSLLDIYKLESKNKTGQYIWLEINLLLRNKRTRQALFMLPVFLIYFFVIIITKRFSFNEHLPTLFFISLLIGFGSTLYGQFIFSWESIYFDGIMARKINFATYVKAKYYLMILLTLAIFLPFLIIFSINGSFDLVLLFSILFFTIGVTYFIVLFSGAYNDGRIDLKQSQFMNYQGMKRNQFILSFFLMLFPICLYLLFKSFTNATIGKMVIAIPGMIFILFHKWWIKNIIVPNFMARKYKNLEGYRKLTI